MKLDQAKLAMSEMYRCWCGSSSCGDGSGQALRRNNWQQVWRQQVARAPHRLSQAAAAQLHADEGAAAAAELPAGAGQLQQPSPWRAATGCRVGRDRGRGDRPARMEGLQGFDSIRPEGSRCCPPTLHLYCAGVLSLPHCQKWTKSSQAGRCPVGIIRLLRRLCRLCKILLLGVVQEAFSQPHPAPGAAAGSLSTSGSATLTMGSVACWTLRMVTLACREWETQEGVSERQCLL